MRIFKLISVALFLGCQQHSDKIIKSTENLMVISRYDENNKICKEYKCSGSILISETKIFGDSIIEYYLSKTDTIIEKDSIGEVEKVNYSYSKKITLEGKTIFEGKADSLDKINDCNCRNSCQW